MSEAIVPPARGKRSDETPQPRVDPNPSGRCHCGCGRATNVVTVSSPSAGYRIGDHYRFLQGHRQRASLAETIIRNIEIDLNGCWRWKASVDVKGYGRLRARGYRTKAAHRIVYSYLVGPIPDGKQLDHLCRVPSCVNPSHLEPVSNTENVRRGNSAKLTKEDVRRIHRSGMSRQALAREFGIRPTYVDQIRRGDAWRDCYIEEKSDAR